MIVGLPRVIALLLKEWADLRSTWAAWLPAVLMAPLLCLPFFVAIVIPAWTHEPLDRSDFAVGLDEARRLWPAATSLSPVAMVQAFIFQQFLVLTALVPVSGAMSLAAHGIVGEKQTRSLEPLLATPLTPPELLLAKVVAALLPALALEALAVLAYLAAVALTAEPGVFRALLTWRSLIVVGVAGPVATLLAIQLVVFASTRAKDTRSAQQVGVLVVVPLIGVMVAQLAGSFWLTPAMLVAAAATMFVLWLVLLWVTSALFDSERVLTTWQ